VGDPGERSRTRQHSRTASAIDEFTRRHRAAAGRRGLFLLLLGRLRWGYVPVSVARQPPKEVDGFAPERTEVRARADWSHGQCGYPANFRSAASDPVPDGASVGGQPRGPNCARSACLRNGTCRSGRGGLPFSVADRSSRRRKKAQFAVICRSDSGDTPRADSGPGFVCHHRSLVAIPDPLVRVTYSSCGA